MTYAHNWEKAFAARHWHTAPSSKACPDNCQLLAVCYSRHAQGPDEGFVSKKAHLKHWNVLAREVRHTMLLHKQFDDCTLPLYMIHIVFSVISIMRLVV